MLSVELANTSNAIVVYDQQPEALKKKINEWIHQPNTYGDQAHASFVQSINSFAIEAVEHFKTHVVNSGQVRLKSIVAKRNRDVDSLRLKPSLIAKSLGCGTLGGLASAQLATQITVAMTLAS